MALLCLGALSNAPGAKAEMKQAAFVLDANTGAVLHEQFADAPRHPASLTKMMTLYMAFEAIKQGRATADTSLTISERAASVAPSKLDLAPGEEIALQDAVKALITKSANDVAVAIAENLGGSEAGFVRLMNAKARDLGMQRTHFTNASGLPDREQITTARDMVILGMRLADDFPDYFRLFSLREFQYRGKVYKSHNTLLHGFPGMDGIKTGYTRMSGFNLVSSVRVDGKHVVAAVFGGSTAQTRNAHMRAILFQTLEKASPSRTRPMPKPGKPAPLLVANAASAPAPANLPPVIVTEPASRADAKPAKREKVSEKKPKEQPPAKAKPAVVTEVANAKPKPAMKFRSSAPDPAVDQIAAVLREQEPPKAPAQATEPQTSASVTPPTPQTPEVTAQVSITPPRLDLEALRNEINNEESVATTAASQAEPVAFATASTAASPTTPDQKPPALPEPSHLNGPASAAPVTAEDAPKEKPIEETSPATGAYAIQIGAFGNEKEAMSRLEVVRSRAATLLQGHAGVAQTATKSGKQIYRARFVAFDEPKASKACSELRRLSVDCFVMKAE